jgi:hypothetical protein
MPGHDPEWNYGVRGAHRRPGSLVRILSNQHPVKPRLGTIKAEPGDKVIGGAHRIDRVLCALVAFGGHEPIREVFRGCGMDAQGYPRAVHVQPYRPGRFV